MTRGRIVSQGFTLWFTGLSGAGKTTLTNALVPQLLARGVKIEVLDGDEVRMNLSKGLGFSKEYREIRDEVRRTVEADGAVFVEVFVKASLGALIARDVKGLYKKALAGEIKQFTGVSDPYEAPDNPELIIESDKETIAESAAKIIAALDELGLLATEQRLGATI